MSLLPAPLNKFASNKIAELQQEMQKGKEIHMRGQKKLKKKKNQATKNLLSANRRFSFFIAI